VRGNERAGVIMAQARRHGLGASFCHWLITGRVVCSTWTLYTLRFASHKSS
jgi:hypothetical protein